MNWEWIQSSVELEAVITAHRGAESVAIDTEFRRRDTFFPIVALVQLCWGDKAYLVDPLQVEIGRAHVRTPVTEKSRMPSSA